MIKDFACPLKNIESLEAWLATKNDKQCPSCLIAPLASYYAGALEEAGETKLRDELKTAFERGDVLTIVKRMDNIKKNVGDKLKQELLNLDCMAQTQE